MREINEEIDVRQILKEAVDDVGTNFQCQSTGTEERDKEATNLQKVVDAYVKVCQMETEEEDRRERRRIEEDKNLSMYALEKEKSNDPFWKYCVEWTIKYILPGALSALAYNEFQKRTLKFEETGSFRSKASRDLKSVWEFWKK